MSQREHGKYYKWHIANVCGSSAFFIILYVISGFNTIAFVGAGAVAIPAMMIWFSIVSYHDTCRMCGTYRFGFSELLQGKAFKHAERLCEKCGKHSTCVLYVNKWRCESCYNDFIAYWNAPEAKP